MNAHEKLRHVLPPDRCCNCDSRLGLTLQAMEFPLDAGGLFDGERWGLILRAPFCALCARTARRRPLRFIEKFFLGFALFFLLVVGTAALPLDNEAIDPMLRLGIAVALGFGLPFVIPRLMRSQHGQSSFWRPIHVAVPRAQVLHRMIENLSFEFTSEPYARSFALANAQAIASGALTSRHRPG